MSSSNRGTSAAEAIVVDEHGVRGPVLLPPRQRSAFIREFNRRYAPVGLTLRKLVPADNTCAKKSSATWEQVTEDDS